MICPDSGSAQLDYFVDGSEIYYPEYPYRSGISKPLEEYQRTFADDIVKRFHLTPGSLCIDIGSNDGTLLTGFKRHQMRALGVEPTNVAQIAREENGIETIQAFFNEAVANEIVREFGPAKIVTMTNVFAHMTTLGEVMRGLALLLDKSGVFVLENQYLLDVLEKNQFDGIYHEHIRTYSLKALATLMPYYDLEVFDVQRASRYGGNIRAYVARKGVHPIDKHVTDLLNEEEEKGLFRPETWARFRERTEKNRLAFMELAYSSARATKRFVANSCPGRGAVLLNYYGANTSLIPYVAELPNGLKVGRYLPGTHTPVISNDILFTEQPEYVVLLAWHYSDYMIGDLRKRGLRSKFVVPLPEFRVVED